ncbi:MAG: thioredoxin family protein [Anaerolineaceae bacterium]|nr:thioredoxin family protein [Anaerolineaceae bacterium]
MSERIIVLYGTKWCGDCRRVVKILKETNIRFTFIDIDQNKEGEIFVKSTNRGNRSVPTIVFPDGSILVEPGNAELIKKLEGINE